MYCDHWSQYIQVRKLFKGGNYSRAETIRENTASDYLSSNILICILFLIWPNVWCIKFRSKHSSLLLLCLLRNLMHQKNVNKTEKTRLNPPQHGSLDPWGPSSTKTKITTYFIIFSNTVSYYLSKSFLTIFTFRGTFTKWILVRKGGGILIFADKDPLLTRGVSFYAVVILILLLFCV